MANRWWSGGCVVGTLALVGAGCGSQLDSDVGGEFAGGRPLLTVESVRQPSAIPEPCAPSEACVVRHTDSDTGRCIETPVPDGTLCGGSPPSARLDICTGQAVCVSGQCVASGQTEVAKLGFGSMFAMSRTIPGAYTWVDWEETYADDATLVSMAPGDREVHRFVSRAPGWAISTSFRLFSGVGDVVTATRDSEWIGWSARTGEELWKHPLPDPALLSKPTVSLDDWRFAVMVPDEKGTELAVVDTRTGLIDRSGHLDGYSLSSGGRVVRPIADEYGVMMARAKKLGSDEPFVVAFYESGAVRWAFPADAYPSGTYQGRVVLSTGDVLSTRDGTKLYSVPSGWEGAPSITATRLYLQYPCADHSLSWSDFFDVCSTVRAFDAASGALLWERRVEGRGLLGHFVVGPDEEVWLTMGERNMGCPDPPRRFSECNPTHEGTTYVWDRDGAEVNRCAFSGKQQRISYVIGPSGLLVSHWFDATPDSHAYAHGRDVRRIWNLRTPRGWFGPAGSAAGDYRPQ